jgi:hypothetical protein
MDTELRVELLRLRDNAALKRDLLLRAAHGHTLRRRRLTLAAGILSLLSAATVTSLLADYTPAPITKIVAVILSTAAGFISLLGNLGVKDNEIQDLYAGATRYLTLRENSHRISLNDRIEAEEKYRLLEEMQGLYSQLDEQFTRHIEDSLRKGYRRRISRPRDLMRSPWLSYDYDALEDSDKPSFSFYYEEKAQKSGEGDLDA